MFDFDVTVVGGGVVGVACAAALARENWSVLLVDRHAHLGQETSSRNSGVVHAGIYDPPGSLKARLCAAGRRLLYERCERHSIPNRRSGKLIVAIDDGEVPALELLQRRAAGNGVNLVLWDEKDLMRREPNLRGVAALFSQESGIVDAHALLYDYQREAKEAGAIFCMQTPVTALDRREEGWSVTTADSTQQSTEVRCRFVVNAAGLWADQLARLAGMDTWAMNLRLHWCKGDYFALDSRWSAAVSRLVYPLPGTAGLGVHLTPDLGGRLVAGPDATYVDRIDYAVAEEKAVVFARQVSRYLPGVTPKDLTPDYAGIRPKLQGPADDFRDYHIEEASKQGLPGLINLIGIESPGLTASEAIAARVVHLVRVS